MLKKKRGRSDTEKRAREDAILEVAETFLRQSGNDA